MKILISLLILVFVFTACSTHQEIKKEINKQEQIYQSEKAFRELNRER
ncbi:hypothetical protein [Hydrogenivirga sp. 128-5-R1-1]|nr:hypothetical protein [Hydrogenivirga sp. 128-5-R1-1]EDP74313.1 hypothetical protein HG1285_08226 [Hydrogenivirga sp. 128-5-R1-1]